MAQLWPLALIVALFLVWHLRGTRPVAGAAANDDFSPN
jgi:hypothetical protein